VGSRVWIRSVAFLLAVPSPAVGRADGVLAPCSECNVLVGVGTTFLHSDWTHGLVLPVLLELDQSRWEIGAFRFATAQSLPESFALPSSHSAEPYWGFSVMRRWQILHRSFSRTYLGVGGSYRTESDYLVNSKWNFSYLLAQRFDLGSHGALLELSLRHWSDAWIRKPDRGQNIIMLSLSF
jgi:Lipid A 3-O-deacylase (PagL)